MHAIITLLLVGYASVDAGVIFYATKNFSSIMFTTCDSERCSSLALFTSASKSFGLSENDLTFFFMILSFVVSA
jgi:hypothetical protein